MDKVAARYSRLFRGCQDFCEFLKRFLTDNDGPKTPESYQLFVAHRFYRSVESLFSVKELCAKRYWVDATLVSRAMVENSISLQWLIQKPEEHLKRYMDHLHVKFWENLRIFEKMGAQSGLEVSPERKKEIEKTFRDIQKKYDPHGKKRKKKLNYKPTPIPDLAAMAEKVKQEVLYDLAYRDFSSTTHGDLWGLLRTTTHSPEGTLDATPKPETGTNALVVGLIACAQVLDIFRNVFKEFDGKEIEEWCHKFDKILEPS